MDYSKYQENIFDQIEHGNSHLIINAVAGSGKTTTILESLKLTSGSVIFLAFNKAIANELRNRSPEHVETSTLHALGFGILKSHCNVKLDSYKLNNICDAYKPLKIPKQWTKDKSAIFDLRKNIKDLVSLIKNTNIDILNKDDIKTLAEFHNIDYSQDIHYDHLKHVFDESYNMYINKGKIDFDDMIWLPIKEKLEIENRYDWVFVDETQDLNPIQLELVLNIVKSDGRIVAVGDPRQSIYGFRGADVNAMNVIKTKLNALEMPLSVSYRCPTSHVENVKNIVSQIESCDGAIKGTIETITADKFVERVITENDPIILSRVNSLCAKFALKLISKGYRAIVKGKDFGLMIKGVVKRLKANSIQIMRSKLIKWERAERKKIEKRKNKSSALGILTDKVKTITTIMDECSSVEEVLNTIDMLFDDSNVNCFSFSTVHKAKGLEADTVFILGYKMFPLRWKNQQEWELEQEMNIKYVAYTRSKNKIIEVDTLSSDEMTLKNALGVKRILFGIKQTLGK